MKRYDVMDYEGKTIVRLHSINEVIDYVKTHKYVYIYSHTDKHIIYDGFTKEGFREG